MANWSNFMELWIPRGSTNRRRFGSNTSFYIKYKSKKIYKIIIQKKNKYFDNMILPSTQNCLYLS